MEILDSQEKRAVLACVFRGVGAWLEGLWLLGLSENSKNTVGADMTKYSTQSRKSKARNRKGVSTVPTEALYQVPSLTGSITSQ